MQKFIRKPSIDMYAGIKVTKDTKLDYENENVKQTLENLIYLKRLFVISVVHCHLIYFLELSRPEHMAVRFILCMRSAANFHHIKKRITI